MPFSLLAFPALLNARKPCQYVQPKGRGLPVSAIEHPELSLCRFLRTESLESTNILSSS